MKKNIVPLRPGPIVEVVWLDSVGTNRWAGLADHLPTPAELMHRSVGYLIHECNTCITLTLSYGGTGNYDSSTTIPVVSVVSKRQIRGLT